MPDKGPEVLDFGASLAYHVCQPVRLAYMEAEMAEKPDWVAGFDRPKGTEIKRIRGNWYLYERSWRYDPKIKRSRKVSGRCLGKITPDGLVPSVSRAERAGRAKAPAVSDVVEVGASTLAWSLTGKTRLFSVDGSFSSAASS